MAKLDDGLTQERTSRERSGRVLGWLSGLGLLVFPWIAAGVLATAATMVGPESWEADRSFPWLLLATVVVGLGWVIYGSLRIPGFRRGALPGATIALALMGAGFLLVWLLA